MAQNVVVKTKRLNGMGSATTYVYSSTITSTIGVTGVSTHVSSTEHSKYLLAAPSSQTGGYIHYAHFRHLRIIYSSVPSHSLLLERSRDTKKRRDYSNGVPFRTTMTTCAEKCDAEWYKLGVDLCLLIMDYFANLCENCSFDLRSHLFSRGKWCPVRDPLTVYKGETLYCWDYRHPNYQILRTWALRDLKLAEKKARRKKKVLLL